MGEVQDGGDTRKSFVAPAIKSIEHYDFARAKICCSLTWLVAKAYGTGTCNLHAVTCTVHEFLLGKCTFASILINYWGLT